MILVGVSSCFPPPIWTAEKEQGGQVLPLRLHRRDLHRLIRGLDDAEVAADHHANRIGRGAARPSESFAVLRNTSRVCPRRRCHADTASITRLPVTSDASSTWMYPHTNTGLVNTAQMWSARAARVGLSCVADGVLHPGVGGHDERRGQASRRPRPPRSSQVHPRRQHVPSRTTTARGSRLEEERGRGPPSRAARRRRRRRSASTPTSSSRTRTPGPAR